MLLSSKIEFEHFNLNLYLPGIWYFCGWYFDYS